MKINDEIILVEFKKKPEMCRCCGREFEEGDVEFQAKEFELSVKGFFEYADWETEERFKDLVPYYQERLIDDELEEVVREYVHGTIDFYACNSEDIVRIESGEVRKVYEAVKKEVLRLLS